MTLTGCIIHGYGVYLYLADEGLPTGASWVLEVVSLSQPLVVAVFPIPNQSSSPACVDAKAMRSIDRAFAGAQRQNRSMPSESLGWLCIWMVILVGNSLCGYKFQTSCHRIKGLFVGFVT